MNAAELYDSQLDRYAKRVYPLFLNACKKQVAPVVEFIRRTGNIDPPLDILVIPNVFIRPIQQAYDTIGVISAKREYYAIRGLDEQKRILDILIDAWRAIFYDYATNYAYRIDNELSETTKEEIRTALKEAYEQGLNADRTATYIRVKVGGRISRHRAVTISRTESATAANLGKRAGADTWLKETSQKGYKQWIGREDKQERGRETDTMHWRLNDTIIPIDEPFTFTDPDGHVSHGMMPGDTNLPGNQRINCRCTLVYMSERRYRRMHEEEKANYEKNKDKGMFELIDLVI